MESNTKLQTYRDLLRRWNQRVDLVAPDTDDVWWEKHFADSALALDALPATTGSVVDVGSGAGFPGMVWAILREEIALTLCEPRGKRAVFLRTVAREVGVDVDIRQCRVEDLPSATFDAAVSRATFGYSGWLDVGRRLVRPGGFVLAMLGPKEPEGWGSASQAGLEHVDLHPYALPTLGHPRRVHVLRRTL